MIFSIVLRRQDGIQKLKLENFTSKSVCFPQTQKNSCHIYIHITPCNKYKSTQSSPKYLSVEDITFYAYIVYYLCYRQDIDTIYEYNIIHWSRRFPGHSHSEPWLSLFLSFFFSTHCFSPSLGGWNDMGPHIFFTWLLTRHFMCASFKFI